MRTMTDQQLEALLFQTMEGEVIRRLMSGNDAQCFTTAQYVEARDKWVAEITGLISRPEDMPDSAYLLKTARNQLRAVRLVTEVSPDVWALRSMVEHRTGEPGK